MAEMDWLPHNTGSQSVFSLVRLLSSELRTTSATQPSSPADR